MAVSKKSRKQESDGIFNNRTLQAKLRNCFSGGVATGFESVLVDVQTRKENSTEFSMSASGLSAEDDVVSFATSLTVPAAFFRRHIKISSRQPADFYRPGTGIRFEGGRVGLR